MSRRLDDVVALDLQPGLLIGEMHTTEAVGGVAHLLRTGDIEDLSMAVGEQVLHYLALPSDIVMQDGVVFQSLQASAEEDEGNPELSVELQVGG